MKKTLRSSKAIRQRLDHQVPGQGTRDPSYSSSNVTRSFLITEVRGKGHTDSLPVGTGDLELIGTQPLVRTRSSLHPLMGHRNSRPRMPGEEKSMSLYDPIHQLLVHGILPLPDPVPGQKPMDPAIPITGTFVNQRPNRRQGIYIVGLLVGAFFLRNRSLLLIDHVRLGHHQGVVNRLPRESSGGGRGTCVIRFFKFFKREISTPSFRIPISRVLRPKMRSNSQIRCLSCFTAESLTTGSSAEIADSLPSCMSFRHRKRTLVGNSVQASYGGNAYDRRLVFFDDSNLLDRGPPSSPFIKFQNLYRIRIIGSRMSHRYTSWY